MTILQIILFIGAMLMYYIGFQNGKVEGRREGIAVGYRRGMAVKAAEHANR